MWDFFRMMLYDDKTTFANEFFMVYRGSGGINKLFAILLYTTTATGQDRM